MFQTYDQDQEKCSSLKLNGNNMLWKQWQAKCIINSNLFIKKVFYVKNLKFNLLSINQLCNAGYKINFIPSNALLNQLRN